MVYEREKMKKNLWKKQLVTGILVFFIGVGFIPNISGVFADYNNEKLGDPIGTLNGDILYVGGIGEGNYTTIQDAIDNASDGDTVFVYSGTYYENVIVNKSINLIGEDRDTTIIDGNRSGDVVYITTDWVNISGFKIRESGLGAGIDVCSNYSTIKENNVLHNCDGIFLRISSNNIITCNNIMSNCGVGLYGGSGIYLSQSSCNTIKGNNVSNNGGDYCGGGISLYESSSNNIITCNNITSNWYDGIYLQNSSNNNISGNAISNNGGSFGGGSIEIWSSSNNNITRNNIISNKKGIFLHSSDNNTILSNNIILNKWFGLSLDGSFNVIKYNNFIWNLAGGGGPFNCWSENYWNRPRLLPKPIIGVRFVIIPTDPPRVIVIPWIYFDWHPAKVPYDIK